jgi:nicotinate (nicotinamide) nucleotide adenylyltransferase
MDNYKTKIGIFLGSFDPFHIGHKEAVIEALGRGMDEVWVIPSVWNPWKTNQPAPIDERFWMAHYELEKVDRAKVLVVVTEPDPEDGKYYTVDQLRKIIRGYGSRYFEFWIIGGKDTVEDIEKWKEGNWILGNFKVLETYRPEAEHTDRTCISSTQIREWIENEKWDKLKEVMCQKSIRYIKNHELYKPV